MGELACLRLNCNPTPNHPTKMDTMVLVLFHMLNKNQREVKSVRGQIRCKYAKLISVIKEGGKKNTHLNLSKQVHKTYTCL